VDDLCKAEKLREMIANFALQALFLWVDYNEREREG
jgi:hypothetical protein